MRVPHTQEMEAFFSDMFGADERILKAIDGRRMTCWATRRSETEEHVLHSPIRGKYGTRGSVSMGEDSGMLTDGLGNRTKVGWHEGRLGIHQDGNEMVHGDLEVDGSTLLHGILTVAQAATFADKLLAKGEATFESLAKFNAGFEVQGEAIFKGDEKHDGVSEYTGEIKIPAKNLSIEGETSTEFVIKTVTERMMGISAAGEVQLQRRS